jgi:hypothetical protein
MKSEKNSQVIADNTAEITISWLLPVILSCTALTSRISFRYTAPSTHGIAIPISRSQICVKSRSSRPALRDVPLLPPPTPLSTNRRLFTDTARCNSMRNSSPDRTICRLRETNQSLGSYFSYGTVIYDCTEAKMLIAIVFRIIVVHQIERLQAR